MKELRCKKCDKLLAKITEPTVTTDETVKIKYTKKKIHYVEVKCSRCKTLNTFEL